MKPLLWFSAGTFGLLVAVIFALLIGGAEEEPQVRIRLEYQQQTELRVNVSVYPIGPTCYLRAMPAVPEDCLPLPPYSGPDR